MRLQTQHCTTRSSGKEAPVEITNIEPLTGILPYQQRHRTHESPNLRQKSHGNHSHCSSKSGQQQSISTQQHAPRSGKQVLISSATLIPEASLIFGSRHLSLAERISMFNGTSTLERSYSAKTGWWVSVDSTRKEDYIQMKNVSKLQLQVTRTCCKKNSVY